MDPGPNGKRPRLGTWSASAPSGASLPHPHQTHSTSTTPRPHPVTPLSSTAHPHHHSGPGSYQPQSYPPRHNSLGTGPPSGHHPHSPPPPLLPPLPLTSSASLAESVPQPEHGHAQSHHPELDRRRFEQETLAPMQDHFRQPGPPPHQQQHQQQHQQPQQYQQYHHQSQSSSPAIPPYHQQQYPPRDSVIKRESGDEGRRSNPATGHALDSLPPHTPLPPSTSTQHHHHHHPPPPPPPPPASLQHQSVAYSVEGHQRHMGYDNGIPGALTSGVYRPSSYQPESTIQTPFESHSSYMPSSDQYYGVYASSSSAKKKGSRATQACDQCRQLKAKCDELKPCKTCQDKGTVCKYRDPVPKATDKAQADILQGLSTVQRSVGSLLNHVQRIEGHLMNRMSKLESSVNRLSGGHIESDAVADGELQVMRRSHFETEEESESQYYGETPREYSERPAPPLMAEDELEQEPGEPVPPGEPAIPMNHTTLASLLLNWPVIRDMVKPHLEAVGIRHVSEYPISIEQNRGVLIVYGRGEDSHPSHLSRNLPPDHGNLDMPDDVSDTATSSPLAVDWGHLGGLSPADQFVEYKGGVLTCDGNPDYSEHKVWSYVTSFEDHILNMHPIIQPQVLKDWVRHFLDSLPLRPTRLRHPKAAGASFAVNNASSSMGNAMPGAKRKRSPATEESEASPTSSGATWGRPERSIHNALVLTILALGKVCQSGDRIPDAVHQTETAPRGSSQARNGLSQSPTQGSPPSLPSVFHPSGLTSPKEAERGGGQSRRSSVQGSGSGAVRHGLGLKKNYEAIPGLEYFALATDILGNHLGGYKNMKNVYALIFAGLYYGQLARPMESFAFIHQAGHKLQVIMRPSFQKFRQIKQDMAMIVEPKYNQLALAFWTCLQLESDLIAELQLPPSGLLSYENDMPPPNMSMLQGFDQKVLDSYPAQLYLRTHLNCIHRMFYAPDKHPRDHDPGELDPKFNNVGSVADAVSDMKWVAASFAFKEEDPPSEDLLTARLRAKYWGAQVITYRPFIRQILHWTDSMKNNNSTSPAGFAISEFRQGVAAPVIDPSTRSPTEIPEAVKEYAKRGIKALIESTRALHNVGPDRPIITNVFGTAHAQWGNLLVLSACTQTNVLSEWVPMDLLQNLFCRTIQFLRQSSTLTGCLRTDMLILQGVAGDLFGRENLRPPGSGTFSVLQTPQLNMSVLQPNTSNAT